MASSCRCWSKGLTPIEVLGVPRAAVLSDQQGDYVFTVDAQNKAQETRVHLGQSTPATVAAIINGLTEGQEVIVEGIQRVRPGMAVMAGPCLARACEVTVMKQVRPGALPLDPAKDKSLEPILSVDKEGGGSRLGTASLPPSLSTDQVTGSGDLSPAGVQGAEPPGLPA